ncbi:MAG: hypothetical protein ABIF04_05435 [Chloroflexota bacterium]
MANFRILINKRIRSLKNEIVKLRLDMKKQQDDIIEEHLFQEACKIGEVSTERQKIYDLRDKFRSQEYPEKILALQARIKALQFLKKNLKDKTYKIALEASARDFLSTPRQPAKRN